MGSEAGGLDGMIGRAAAGEPLAWLARPGVVVGLIGFYLLGHFLLRLALSPTLGIDDAEQILFAQRWDFGYRFRQPPLFTWLLLPVIKAIGPGVLAISLVRYALLGATFLFFYLAARLCLHDQRMAGLAALSFPLIYVFGYYAHHDLTHTTALGAMIALAFYVFARLAARPTWTAHLLLGLVFGLGLLAKWNFLMLAIGLSVTCLALPEQRHLILSWKTLAAIGVMAAVTLPTALWMIDHGQSLQGVSGNILGSSNGALALTSMLAGGGALLRSILLFPQPLLLIVLLAFAPDLRAGASRPERGVERALPPSFFGWLTLIVLALHLPLLPIFGAVDFTERWFHPALMALPIFVFGLLERSPPARPRIAFYLAALAILVAVAAGARLYRYAEGADRCGSCREFAPFAELAHGLRVEGFAVGTIVADGMHIGGNLKMLFADSRVMDPAFPMPLWPSSETDGACLLAWRDEGEEAQSRRDAMRRFADRELGLPTAATPVSAGRIEAPLIGSSSRRYALGFELYRETAGGCR